MGMDVGAGNGGGLQSHEQQCEQHHDLIQNLLYSENVGISISLFGI